LLLKLIEEKGISALLHDGERKSEKGENKSGGIFLRDGGGKKGSPGLLNWGGRGEGSIEGKEEEDLPAAEEGGWGANWACVLLTQPGKKRVDASFLVSDSLNKGEKRRGVIL